MSLPRSVPPVERVAARPGRLRTAMLYLAVLYAMSADPEWATRDAAERELVRRVAADPVRYGPRLESLAAGATSPEVAARVRRPLRVWDTWRADSYAPRGIYCWPVCDCFPRAVGFGVDIRDRGAVPPAGGGYTARDAGPYWHRWRRGTELMARRMIREGVPAAEVDALLLRMMRLEIECDSDCNARGVLESWQGRPWAGGYPEP